MDDEPLSNAIVLIWSVDVGLIPRLLAEEATDGEGSFASNVETSSPTCLVHVYYDEPSTEGIDTFPAVEEIDAAIPIHSLNFTLTPASTVILRGPIRFVDSSSNINDYMCEVLDPRTEDPIHIGSFRLIYGTWRYFQNHYLRLDPNIIVVPPETTFELRLSPSY